MLRKQDCLKFAGVLHDRVFFENNFADFTDVVRVKKRKNQDFVQPLVVFPISNISYYYLIWNLVRIKYAILFLLLISR